MRRGSIAKTHRVMTDSPARVIGREAPNIAGQPAAVERDERRTYTVREAAGILGIAVNGAYEAIRRGDIPAIRLGHRLVVPRKAFDRLVDGLRSEGEA